MPHFFCKHGCVSAKPNQANNHPPADSRGFQTTWSVFSWAAGHKKTEKTVCWPPPTCVAKRTGAVTACDRLPICLAAHEGELAVMDTRNGGPHTRQVRAWWIRGRGVGAKNAGETEEQLLFPTGTYKNRSLVTSWRR